ncbi:MAG: hypothetical protein JXB17_08985 [Bacteroidales bacterium]|nr:hypothetical protein [Bacteroidales bacterium]
MEISILHSKIRNFSPAFFIKIAISVLLSYTLISCEGPQGKDANETCKQCHNSGTELLARQMQFGSSMHLNGTNYKYNEPECATCHTHEGYTEAMQTGENFTITDISNPSPVTCRTCHKIHEKYDSTDWELRTTNSVILQATGEEADFGKANQCANCHQPWKVNPLPVIGEGSLTIASAEYGPHHSPQAALFKGIGGFEYPGIEYPSSSHKDNITNACITCHMAEAIGNEAGGHTFSMVYFEGRSKTNTAGCLSCHTDEIELNNLVYDVQEHITLLTNQLYSELFAEGIVDTTGKLNVPVTLSPEHAYAYLNYITVVGDRSKGIHNYPYIRKLLESSIQALQ